MEEPKKNSEEHYAAGEFLASLLLIATSIFVALESLRMPQRGPIPFVTSPGFFPFLLGVVLLLLSLFVLFDTTRGGGYRQLRVWIRDILKSQKFRRLFSIVLLTGGYVLLLGKVPFAVATMAYFFGIFTYLRVGGPIYIAIYSLGFSLFVAYVLPKLFEMPLP